MVIVDEIEEKFVDLKEAVEKIILQDRQLSRFEAYQIVLGMEKNIILDNSLIDINGESILNSISDYLSDLQGSVETMKDEIPETQRCIRDIAVNLYEKL